MSLTFRGSSQSVMALILDRSIVSPAGDRMYPKYSTVSELNTHFSVCKEIVFLESLKDFPDMGCMFDLGVRVYQDVIQIS